jgi:DNA-binding HxlR family transcriptional regulator
MRTYEQYCPIARAAEIFAERWTPLIVRNIHAGCRTYCEILEGAPGLSHTLLTQRLRHLTDVGIIAMRPKPNGRGVRYELTSAGHDLWPVLSALGAWGERWVELRDEHTNPRFLLWTWSTTYLARKNLPDRRVVVRFELFDRPTQERRVWMVVSPAAAEVCTKRPGFHDDLVVETTAMVLVQWHTRQIEWAEAVRAKKIRVSGPRALAMALPTWNLRSSSPWRGEARPSISRPASAISRTARGSARLSEAR